MSGLDAIVFSAEEVAQVIGIEAYDLQKLHPAYFGVPGHWHLNKQGAAVYTEKGIEGLVETLAAKDSTDAAAALHSLLVDARQAREVPSRAAVSARPKNDWRERADLQ